MMKSLIGSVIFLCGAGALMLLAADSWRTKPYTAWDDKEVQKILNDSPWARGVTIMMNGAGGSVDGPHSNSPLAGAGGGPGGGGTGGGGGRNGGGEGLNVPTVRLLLRFVSALPVRQAMMRERYGDQVATSPAAVKILSTPDNYYVVALAGLHRLPENVPVIKQKSTLRAKGKESFGPAEVRAENGMIVLFFLRDGHPIAVEDGEVEVQVQLPDLVSPIRRSFKLKDMMYAGKLEM
jgi:hypothetical protein